MKTLVVATFLFCFNTGECMQKQVQIDPKICHVGKLHAKIPDNGEWKDGTISIKC